MSKDSNFNCVLIGPGHNLPSELTLVSQKEKPFTEGIVYLDHGVFRIGDCSCGHLPPRYDWRDLERGNDLFTDFDAANSLGNGEKDPFPYRKSQTGCQELFTVHNFEKLQKLLESTSGANFEEISLGYPHTRVLREVSTGETFWLKGNDGAIVRSTPVFYEVRFRMSGCTSFYSEEEQFYGPVILGCLTSEGEVLDETV